MGGEKNKELEGVWLPMGSPPRRRGKVVHCAAVRALRGITPRVGGEKLWSNGLRWCWVGSPPRGRGKAEHESRKNRFPGITPAWAGKRSRKDSAPLSVGDHPRVGGEKLLLK